MQIRQLEMLRSVIRRSSYSAAAEELGLTQPAVSMQMKALADEIGAALFERRGLSSCVNSECRSPHLPALHPQENESGRCFTRRREWQRRLEICEPVREVLAVLNQRDIDWRT